LTVRSVFVVILLVLGVGLQALSCLGLCVMRDVHDRLHYVAPAGFGALLIAVAIVVQESFSIIGNKALATAALLVVTGPVLVHVTIRTARIREVGEWNVQSKEQIEVEER
jgi:multisubunit Na+/H+ antiporter MnhG subunit